MIYIPPNIPVPLRDDPKLRTLLGDISTFAKLHKVQDKDSKSLIPFNPLPMQEKIFRAVQEGHNRIIVLKARQVAATTAAKMVLYHLANSSPNASMHALLSMREDSATSLLDDPRRWVDHLPGILRRETKSSKNTITWADTKASLRAFTSRSQSGLRSYSPAAVVISEAAYAPNLEEVIAQVDAAVGQGILIVESTANNPADFFSRLCRDTPDAWHLITHWWWEHPAYSQEAPEDFSPTPEESLLQRAYGLDNDQLYWRRNALSRLGSETKFRKEYPGCMEDCFIDRDGGYFEDSLLSNIQTLDFNLAGTSGPREIESPKPYDKYVMGVDVGGGVGGDYSTLAVVSVSTMQPVYAERSNRITPAQWAHRAIQVATRYNNAMVLAESNNHGHALLLELNSCGYREQWRDPKTSKPWTTTLQSKIDAFATLRESLQMVQIMDRTTYMELRALTIPPGKVAPEAPNGSHDDSAIAIALAYRCLRDIPSNWRTQAASAKKDRIQDLLAANRARRIRTRSLPF